MKRNFIIAAAQAVLSMTTAIERRENTCICAVPADGQAKFSYRIFGTCRRIYVCGAGYGKSFLLQVACRPKVKKLSCAEENRFGQLLPQRDGRHQNVRLA